MFQERCGGSLVVHQASEGNLLGSNPVSPTMILGALQGLCLIAVIL